MRIFLRTLLALALFMFYWILGCFDNENEDF